LAGFAWLVLSLALLLLGSPRSSSSHSTWPILNLDEASFHRILARNLMFGLDDVLPLPQSPSLAAAGDRCCSSPAFQQLSGAMFRADTFVQVARHTSASAYAPPRICIVAGVPCSCSSGMTTFVILKSIFFSTVKLIRSSLLSGPSRPRRCG
jgi:hypothetical protein